MSNDDQMTQNPMGGADDTDKTTEEKENKPVEEGATGGEAPAEGEEAEAATGAPKVDSSGEAATTEETTEETPAPGATPAADDTAGDDDADAEDKKPEGTEPPAAE